MKKSTIITLCIILFNIIGGLAYSELSRNLEVVGDADVRSQLDLRINGIEVASGSNSSYSDSCSYTENSTTVNVNLEAGSSITYKVSIKNKTGESFVSTGINLIENTNTDVSYSVSDLVVSSIYSGESYDFYVTYTASSDASAKIKIQFDLEIYVPQSWEYKYIGTYWKFTAPSRARYRIELWGAGNSGSGIGYGSYTSGEIVLDAKTDLYIYVGSKGAERDGNTIGGWNGGGNSTATTKGASGPAGSGATDVRYFSSSPSSSDLNWNSSRGLRSRIMVAAAGAGDGIDGGGIEGHEGPTDATYYQYYGKKATQTAGGAAPPRHSCGQTDGTAGGFGYGGNGGKSSNSATTGGGAAGSSGYYGGSGAGGLCNGDFWPGSGSSYISGHTGCVAIISESNQSPKSGCSSGTTNNSCSVHYSNKVFTNTKMIDGTGHVWTNIEGGLEAMPSPSVKGEFLDSGVGNSDNGFARITLISMA